jgi:hypothetical protein
VSHPFRGALGELYDPYVNSGEIMTNLILAGYSGAFLLLDNLRGLNYEVAGVPAWLVWFSMIASHSDIVLFVRERGRGFSDWQQQEIAFTPDRVQKKIVEIEELTWVDVGPGFEELAQAPVMYIGSGGEGSDVWSDRDLRSHEAEHAGAMIDEYAEPGIRRDCLFRLDEDGVEEFPHDYPIYGA